MGKIALTQGKFALVDGEDFEYLNQWNWYFANGYAVRNMPVNGGKRVTIRMHRVINKTPDGLDTDHKNGDGLDNQKANLRDATQSENNMNKVKWPGCSSRYKGVSWNKRASKWQAYIRPNGKLVHLGLFICEIIAAAKYDEEAEKYFGQFAALNFSQVITS